MSRRRHRRGYSAATAAQGRTLVLGLLWIILPAAPQHALAQESSSRAAWSRTSAADETRGALAERGAAVFNNWCSACHSRDTRNAPGTVSLEHKYQGTVPAALEDRQDLTLELVELYVRNGVATMPFYRKTELSDDDVAALAAYLEQ